MLVNYGNLSLATYNVLFEILIEQMSSEIRFDAQRYPVFDASNSISELRFENPAILKVIATLLTQSTECDELLRVKELFIEDLLRLCKESRENRRYNNFFKILNSTFFDFYS